MSHFFISPSARKDSFSDLNGFKDSHIPNLFQNELIDDSMRLFFVGFDASHIVISGGLKFSVEIIDFCCKFLEKSFG
jgi:hypothetical protein